MRVRSTIAALSWLPLTLLAGPGRGPVAAGDVEPAALVIESSSPDWTRRIEWGLGRMRAAGLTLPPLVITVHDGDDKTPCEGHDGFFQPADPAEIRLCVDRSPILVDSSAARWITLHELAHAWAETQLTVADRTAFLERRELDIWLDERIPSYEWGAEHAAEVVTWGLMEKQFPVVRIYDSEPVELSGAFDLLVGRPPLWSAASSEP